MVELDWRRKFRNRTPKPSKESKTRNSIYRWHVLRTFWRKRGIYRASAPSTSHIGFMEDVVALYTEIRRCQRVTPFYTSHMLTKILLVLSSLGIQWPSFHPKLRKKTQIVSFHGQCPQWLYRLFPSWIFAKVWKLWFSQARAVIWIVVDWSAINMKATGGSMPP